MTDVASRSDARLLRRNRDFGLLWAGTAGSLLGSRASAVGYPMLVLWHSGSGLQAGVVTSAALAANLLVPLHAGVFVDRWDRRRLMIACELGRGLVVAGVVLVVATGHLWLGYLAVAAMVESGLAIVHQLAERGAVRRVVAPRQLGAALSRNEARGRAAVLLGVPLGTGLFALGRWLPFVLALVGYSVSLGTLLLIRAKLQLDRPAAARRLRAEVREGLGWLWRQRFLRTAVGTVACSNLFFHMMSLAVMYRLLQDERLSPATVGIVLAASGVGGVLGALTGGWWARRITLRATLVGGKGVYAVVMPLLALAHGPVQVAALLVAISYAGAASNVVAGVYQAGITPDELQGRVSGAAGLLASGGNALGALLGGVLLDAWGSTSVLVVAGCAVGVLVVTAAATPAVRAARHTAMEEAGS